MSARTENERCNHLEQVPLYVAQALPANEAALMQEHLNSCFECRKELKNFQPVISSFASWPTDLLIPSESLWGRLVSRLDAGTQGGITTPAPPPWQDPEWADVAPGISCKLLVADTERDLISMLVRLAPDAEYPPHSHAGIEELHLLQGELWIDDRRLYPGDYNRAEVGTADKRVWSETGCTCVLITSTLDVLQ